VWFNCSNWITMLAFKYHDIILYIDAKLFTFLLVIICNDYYTSTKNIIKYCFSQNKIFYKNKQIFDWVYSWQSTSIWYAFMIIGIALTLNNDGVLHFIPFGNIQDDVGDISVVLDSIKILPWSWLIAIVRAKHRLHLTL